MPVFRTADPVPVQNVWNAIRVANSQKQVPDMNNITKYVQKALSCSPAQGELYVKHALEDGMILTVPKVGAKGNGKGHEIESYQIPLPEEEILLRTGHDWYCIDCHLAGDVTQCATCFRVFHPECTRKKEALLNDKPPDITNTRSNGRLLQRQSAPLNESTFYGPSGSSNNILKTDCGGNSVLNHSKTLNNNQNCLEDLFTKDVYTYYDEAVCSICNMCRMHQDLEIDSVKLNYLLSFVHNRIHSWIPTDWTKCIGKDEVSNWYTEKERHWRVKQLIYENINMTMIGHKLQANEYQQPYEYKADVLTVQHGVAVYHGTESEEYNATVYMLKDCSHEIDELENCLDCYKNSNEKVDQHWFCIPCRNPHKLVWAKQHGHPYWPAKLLKETDSSCDVRFFGGKYERALLSKANIKPITVSMNTLPVGKSPAFSKAVGQLHRHQKLLTDMCNMDTTIQDMEPSEQNENSKRGKRSSRTIKSSKLVVKPSITQKRSHSLESSEKAESVGKTTKRRNSCAVLHNTVAKRRIVSVHQTRQTIPHNTYGKKKTMSNGVPMLNATTTKSTSTRKNSNDQAPDISLESDRADGMPEIGNDVTISSVPHVPQDVNSPEVNINLPRPIGQFSASVEKMRHKMEKVVDKDQLINIALECMQAEIDKLTTENEKYLKTVVDAHNNAISDTKKKQWCYYCDQDAIYHCCWNTAYCSLACQQEHWLSEHKKVCRRKR